MAITVDEMLEKLGDFGRYQWFLLFIFGFVVLTLNTFPSMIVTFITAEPDWICVNGNNSVCNFTEPISLTSEHYEARCSMPRDNWTFVDDFTSTVTEYELVCEKSYLQSVVQSCFWGGSLVGFIAAGYLADRFGRKPVFIAGAITSIITTWVMVFSNSIWVFLIGRLLCGIASGFISISYYVLCAECVTEKYRARITSSIYYFWVLSLCIMALLGYFIRDWRYLLLSTVALATPGLLLWCVIPESLRWLSVHDKTEKTKKIISKIAKFNKKPLPQEDLKILGSVEDHGNFKHLFRDWNTAKRTLVCWNLVFTVNLVYFGVAYSSVDLGWDRYLTFALTSLVELPSDYASIPAANRLGRKKSTILGLLMSCLAAVIAISIPADEGNKGYVAGRIIMAAAARFFINATYLCQYLWTVELFPTFVRSMAISSAAAFGAFGSFTASYVIWLIRIHPMLPYGIMGILCLESVFVALSLPETKGCQTMEVMSDMEKESANVQLLMKENN